MPSQELKDAEYYMKILRQHMPELRDKYSVNYLGVFGSYIRGEQTEDSDLDVLVQFDKKPGLLKYIELLPEMVSTATVLPKPIVVP